MWGSSASQRRKRELILEQQKQSASKASEIAGIIQGIRNKTNWKNKILNEKTKEKYKKEAKSQGISNESIDKAFLILEAITKLSNNNNNNDNNDSYDEDNSTSITSLTINQDHNNNNNNNYDDDDSNNNEDENIIIQVGERNFNTTIKILRADRDSMLNKMFSSQWRSNNNNNDHNNNNITQIQTPSNSPVVFSNILDYLQALSTNSADYCPNIDSLTFEQLGELQFDCQYFGLRRLSIAIEVRTYQSEVKVAKEQKNLSTELFAASTNLKGLKEEQIRLEERLRELPELISKAEEEEKRLKELRKNPKTRWIPQVGDEVMINTKDDKWEKVVIEEVNGVLCHKKNKLKRKFIFLKNDDDDDSDKKNDNDDEIVIPLPSPEFFHPASTEYKYLSDILQRDDLLPKSLSQSLEEHLDNLLDDKPIDLHPGSDGQVIDLIHPSLYPYIKDVTVVSDEEEFKKCAEVEDTYSWLPSEFKVDEKGNVSIESYINNLDRETHPDLYFEIALAFQTMLPMFEQTLNQNLNSKTLQVIVKAAYYFIPPGEKYTGSWHVEGMEHENIIASGIYYLSVSENIKNNYLEFRTLVDESNFYDQNGYPGQEVELIENLGSIPTPTGRTIVWKNDLQHKVGELSIKDSAAKDVPNPTGIRKILCFFLVNPLKRIVSTKIVPKQQEIIPLKEAFKHRQALMNIRKYNAQQNSDEWESRVYTFCEH